jgi:glycosyltransferase involved in cell wall biosynthesis
MMKTQIPQADFYHCVATGYAGVLGSMAKHIYGCGLMISEHGIYTREREEVLLKANWVAGVYKNIWIDQFRKMSKVAYERADMVTCLYAHAMRLQIGLGCPEKKIVITPNGIDTDRLANLPGKLPTDQFINIGAVLRVTPIKDVKTMLRAFAFAKQRVPNLRLWVMGPCDEDAEYARECLDLVEQQGIDGVFFTGRVDIREYLGRMDFTNLISISEGQPLTILESYAARKPVIATDVGNCRELIYGEDDGCGTAGILTHIMNVSEISNAMVEMATSPHMRAEMAKCGYNRVMKRYRLVQMKKKYRELYRKMAAKYECIWTEEDFDIRLHREK